MQPFLKAFPPSLRLLTIVIASWLISACENQVTQQSSNEIHHQSYLKALEKASVAKSRLIFEMNRIQSGTVSHYDFLQYEHIELIRHSKALNHPPASLPETVRIDLKQQAKNILDSANVLEWVIADFLRAHSLMLSSRYNLNDLIDKNLKSSNADQFNRLLTLNKHLNRYLIQQTGEQNLKQAVQDFKRQPSKEINAFIFQTEQLINQAPLVQAAFKALLDSPIDHQAWLLTNTYTLATSKD